MNNSIGGLSTSSRQPEIDLLRAWAIGLVLFRHTHYSLPITIKNYPTILQGTWSGVDLFFVISGFIITISLQPSYQLLKDRAIGFRTFLFSFLTRRIFRLLPIALLALVANLLLTRYFNLSDQFGPWEQVRTEIIPILLYYYNYHIWTGGSANMGWYWSLSIEEQFYFLYPFLLGILRDRRIQLIFFWGCVASITFLIRPLTMPPFESVDRTLWPIFTTPSHLRFDGLFAGCGTALIYLYNKEAIINWVTNNRTVGRSIAVLALFGVATCGILLPHYELTGYPAIIVCSVILLLLAATGQQTIPSLGMDKLFNWIGRRSYSIYLFHLIIIHAINECWLRIYGLQEDQLGWGIGFLGIALTWLLTALIVEMLYRSVESKCIGYGHQLSSRMMK